MEGMGEAVSRVAEAFSKPFRSVDSDQEHKVEPPPKELLAFCADTATGALAGLMYGATREWFKLRSEGPIVRPDGVAAAVAARMQAEEATVRLLRFMNSALRGSLQVGGFTAVFVGTRQTVAIARDVDDFVNSAVAGSVTGGAFGFLASGGRGPASRLQSLLMGSMFGLAVSVPMGMAQEALQSALEQDEEGSGDVPSKDGAEGHHHKHESGADIAIKKLEASLGNILHAQHHHEKYAEYVEHLEGELRQLRQQPRSDEIERKKSEVKERLGTARMHHQEYLKEDRDMAGIVADVSS